MMVIFNNQHTNFSRLTSETVQVTAHHAGWSPVKNLLGWSVAKGGEMNCLLTSIFLFSWVSECAWRKPPSTLQLNQFPNPTSCFLKLLPGTYDTKDHMHSQAGFQWIWEAKSISDYPCIKESALYKISCIKISVVEYISPWIIKVSDFSFLPIIHWLTLDVFLGSVYILQGH